jgi:hypothetical protein
LWKRKSLSAGHESIFPETFDQDYEREYMGQTNPSSDQWACAGKFQRKCCHAATWEFIAGVLSCPRNVEREVAASAIQNEQDQRSIWIAEGDVLLGLRLSALPGDASPSLFLRT